MLNRQSQGRILLHFYYGPPHNVIYYFLNHIFDTRVSLETILAPVPLRFINRKIMGWRSGVGRIHP